MSDIDIKEGRMKDGRVVLCGANSYEQKYFFNEEMFGKIPESMKEELHVICVLFTEECGGIFMFVFEEDGSISMETVSDESDYLYDEISAGLLTHQIKIKRQDMFEALSMYYMVFILHEKIDGMEDINV